jgi:prepilin-type N-terminal cleavage/methylation domain-containing protein
MNNRQKTKCCFTLVEMLVVVAIVAILTTMVIGIASRIENREKEKHCRSSLALLTTALAQFHEYGFNYKNPNYSAFNFPLDCNDFPTADVEGRLKVALGAWRVQIYAGTGAHDPNYSGDEVMYLLLSMVPASRQTLGKIDGKLVTNLLDGQPMKITIFGSEADSGKVYPLFRVVDPWGTALRYDCYQDWDDYHIDHPGSTWGAYIAYIKDNRRHFPLVTSAGPDKKFDTDDDIRSR